MAADQLKRMRRPMRSLLVKRIHDIEIELDKSESDKAILQAKLDILRDTFVKVETLDRQVLEALSASATDDEIDNEVTEAADYEERFRVAKLRTETEIDQGTDVHSDSDSSTTTSRHGRATASSQKRYKLPKIELKKFDGQLKNWLSFWAQFGKIHDDESLHSADKFQYLIQSMVSGSEPEELLASYPVTASNYEKAVSALKERYGRDNLLLQVYVRDLLELVISNATQNDQLPLDRMYMKLESHLRALNSLNLSQADPATWLFPLVESSLPEDTLRAWQRSPQSKQDNTRSDRSSLDNLMDFLKSEVQNEQQIILAKNFQPGQKEETTKIVTKKTKKPSDNKTPTAAGLLAGQNSKNSCVFCEKAHDSQICITAQTMAYGLKKRKIMEKGACLCCLRVGHRAKACKSLVKCIVCQKKHLTLMCPELEVNKRDGDTAKSNNNVEAVPEAHSNLNCTNDVLLQTLRAVVRSENGSKKEVRVLLDPGSQKSYILEKTARKLGLTSEAEVKVCHLLFGGHRETQQHNVYEVDIESSHGRNKPKARLKLLGHEKICGKIPRMSKGPWLAELKDKKIFLNDLGEDEHEIELLIGSDYYPQWITGKKYCLQNGLVALETSFGWTVSGKLSKVHDEPESNVAMPVTSMFLAEANVSELWNLETIGIHEPTEKKADKESESEAKQHFLETVRRSDEGRYVVSLPWIEADSSYILDNRDVAEKRLASITTKLQAQGKYQEYSKVFDDWVAEDIIEVVDETVKKDNCYYLPHRPVFKPDSQTTPVRPVFDASCKTGRKPSLNELLEKGPNLIELIPTILLRFRRNEIGVISDIRKAFQMIEVEETDRDFLRFLWWEDPLQQDIRVYRHKRVVFGVNCSPFLLAAILELHLKTGDHLEIAEKLLKSFYVDNCVTSVHTYEEYEHFRDQATQILSDAKMELRDWEFTLPAETSDTADSSRSRSLTVCDVDQEQNSYTKVLGLVWDKVADCLSCEIPVEDDTIVHSVTKRGILSYITKIFDPIGLLCPAVLPVKLILQSAWVAKVGWDECLPEEVVGKFKKWHDEIKCLQDVHIVRHVSDGLCSGVNSMQLHTFCDASQSAYAAVVFLRTADEYGHISVQLLMAKSRLAPVKRLLTIPRMELLACLIGARLTKFVRESLDITSMPCFMWSDSTTAISWIKRNDEWGTFVGNRVKEICSLSIPEDWRHVPGVKNPADLPSRGCSPAHLLESRWWEGPDWLHFEPDNWPVEQFDVDEAAVFAERRKTAQRNERSQKMTSVDLSCLDKKCDCREESTVLVATDHGHYHWYMMTSSYVKNIRIVAWIRRFTSNSKPSSAKQTGSITMQEFCDAETLIVRSIQQEEFHNEAKTVKNLLVDKASDGLLHVRTKLTHSRQSVGFRYPVLLPSGHPFVILMIRWYHLKYYHAGTQFLMSKIRESFWVLRSRRTISKVIRRCTTCLRYTSKSLQADPAALPISRTEAGSTFATTGVDLAGPLYLKNGDKVWAVLFTCAVYRCVHLDFVTSLSTEMFLNALERFINVRGRPHQIYSDNGSNFIGAVSLFSKLNWNKVEALANTHQIKWIFNPPSASWWGGWWERLIRTVKDLLKRMLGKARLDYEQLRTSLSHVENIINERPLTVVTEDQNDLVPLTPAMFLRGIKSSSFPEGTLLQGDFQDSYQKRQSLQQELKSRFQKEYLSQLVQRAGEVINRQPKLGDVVLVGSDDKKRLQWPLARIIELIPGRDGIVRTAKVKTLHGMLLRPIQRLYPLEVSSSEEVHAIQERKRRREVADVPGVDVTTRIGRKVNRPKRLMD